jgi:hypothetical protein
MGAVPILKGNKAKHQNFAVQRIADKYNGKLSKFNPGQIKRMIIKMLIRRVLKEQFVENQYCSNAYLQTGARANDLNSNKIKFYITVGKTKPSKKDRGKREVIEEVEESEVEQAYNSDHILDGNCDVKEEDGNYELNNDDTIDYDQKYQLDNYIDQPVQEVVPEVLADDESDQII